jgi:hypothetical protein
MKNVKISDFLTEEEIESCVQIARTIKPSSAEFVDWVADKITGPNIERINKALGQENDARYFAYAVAYVLGRAQELIESEAQVCFDVCSGRGMIFDNVKHMSWLTKAVLDEIDGGEEN